jgi:hypothetical protein
MLQEFCSRGAIHEAMVETRSMHHVTDSNLITDHNRFGMIAPTARMAHPAG